MKETRYTLGSLFDGSGGFPFAGSLCGIEPRWASEVEPYPIAVTRERFPNMKHLGDISKINGAEIEPVDIITFGSPCQDLSVAGKRAGLKHEANGDDETTRSGLFMEAVRIIKEMRRATNGKHPRFALWENVPGAFSSNRGEDFRVVCEELIKIVEPSAVMPPVPQAGWAYADSYLGDGWSLAYRVFDAQYWGVPQRRRRIHLVVDFRGERAREVLFERQGVRGYFAEGGKAWQGAPADAEGGAGADDREGTNNGIHCVIAIDKESYASGEGFNRKPGITIGGPSATLQAQGVPRAVCYVAETYDARGNGNGKTVSTITGDHENRITDYSSVVVEHKPTYCLQGNGIDRADTAGCNGKCWKEDTCYTLNTIDRPAVAYGFYPQMKAEGIAWTPEKSVNLVVGTNPGFQNGVCYRQGGFADYVEGEVGTLKASGGDLGGESENLICERKVRYIVRRLTPTECARLQGFADWWGHIEPKDNLTDEEYRFWLEVRNTHATINGKPTKEYTKAQMLTWYNKLWTDSAEYKMWGNGIAIPPALYVLQGMEDVLNGRTNRNQGLQLEDENNG
jgi:DNA (cytosine-5)-methyltransferase 1